MADRLKDCNEDGVDINYRHVLIKNETELQALLINNDFLWKIGRDIVVNFNDDGTLTTLDDKKGTWKVENITTVTMNYSGVELKIEFNAYGELGSVECGNDEYCPSSMTMVGKSNFHYY